nr:reverse transcriptase domain-containing protein [Tanacetum cinerariifolium]
MRYSANYNQMTANKIDVVESACEEYSQEVLGFSNVTDNGTPTPQNDPIVSVTSHILTPFGDSDFLLFEEADAFLGLEDDPDSPKIKVELKDLPHHLEYTFLEGNDKLPVIIAKELRNDYKPAVQHQRRVNPKIHDVIKKEVEKLLDDRLIYPISDSPWVSPDAKARLLRWVLLLQEFDFQVLDTKGAENLAADHLSRLEIPYENVLDPKEINEKFSLETLGMVTFRGDSSAPCDVCTKRKLSTFSKLATMDPRGDIMVQISLLRRSLMPVSSGPPFKKMPMSLLKIMTRANDKENFCNGMRCLRIPSKLVKSLTYGALILWASSRLHEGTSIFLWRLTIYQNG